MILSNLNKVNLVKKKLLSFMMIFLMYEEQMTQTGVLEENLN